MARSTHLEITSLTTQYQGFLLNFMTEISPHMLYGRGRPIPDTPQTWASIGDEAWIRRGGLSPEERVRLKDLPYVELERQWEGTRRLPPTLNGYTGTLRDWDTSRRRWRVTLDSPTTSDAPLREGRKHRGVG